MKSTAYLEQRYTYLKQLCDDFAAKKTNATAMYLGRVRALNAHAGEEIPFCALVREFGLTQFESDVPFVRGSLFSIHYIFYQNCLSDALE